MPSFFLILINLLISYILQSNNIINLFFEKTAAIQSNTMLDLFMQFLTVALVFSYGYIIKIFTQSVINDKIKTDYLTSNNISNESFEILREEVVKILKSKEVFKKLFDTHPNNDYLLYVILAKDIKSPKSYHGQVEIIAYIYGALMIATLLNIGWVLLVLPSANIFFAITILIILILILVVLTKRTPTIIDLATKRYIARNTRLYVNFLLMQERIGE